ncbi:MAG: 30S ribosomal protein S6 [Alphaproteobacteria bacterium]|jgi:small subunit ribosomal protein S6|uniref:30S ribosomal protein S6 n=1 Tax=unclassified Sphingopyxis TaxID=2614943 RepID=UPI00285C936F|nr:MULTISPECIES: 30S ribosomal protein S6 [unclassified Sphingopyxis]MBU0823670.1 30S ribosomal protein S6 [Alphaproteobacteria bacterium]MDZ4365565.1 30S ribosomal protein S6 [Afipia sp.]MBU0865839.1 30S ribosomal protein S6 [Alphaproteobacteria bacterium]MBU1823411.1 30S ribosomal protein S6 [Alphaproteobacteria bacterium]MDR6832348.1 small subunit ribosomal protein S6 [Sphingopyxis sp. BE122]
MPFYEHVFIARQDLSQAQVDALAETVTNVITEYKGEVHKTETWGLKQLAYKIQKNRKGHYVMLSAEVSGEAIAEIERQAAISEDIIRWMTIKVDELEKGPSVMMRKQERRGGRGERGGRDRDGEE